MALLGVLIALGLMLALPFWLGFSGQSWLWLIAVATAMTLVGTKPITLYNNVVTELHRGKWGNVFWLLLSPFAMMGLVTVVPFLIGRWVG